MGDHQHRTAEAGEERLQPLEAVEVEVVGRLVEQQDGRPREQHAGQQRPRRLAAAELAEGSVERDVRDPERVARAVELRLQRPAVERAEALLHLAVQREHRGLPQPAFEPLELTVQPPHLAEGGAEQAVDRQVRAWRLLRRDSRRDPPRRA